MFLLFLDVWLLLLRMFFSVDDLGIIECWGFVSGFVRVLSFGVFVFFFKDNELRRVFLVMLLMFL